MPEDGGENTLLDANMEGCHAVDRILGDRPGMAEQKTELVHHDTVGLFLQRRDTHLTFPHYCF